MVEFPRTILGIAFIARTCKAFVQKCRQNKKSQSSKELDRRRSESINEDIFEEDEGTRETMKRYNSFRSLSNNSLNSIHDPKTIRRSRSCTKKRDKNNNTNNNKKTFKNKSSSTSSDINKFFSCSPLSNITRNYSGSLSRKSSTTDRGEESSSSPSSPPFLSRRGSNGRIMFSNSFGMLKPPPIERNLDCTLEDLCYGVQKKIKITRDVVKDTGIVVQEEEILTIKVKPGWKKGTKIRFEGVGNENPGLSSRADVVFVICEKRHSVFRREGDDLKIAIEIPLVQALTGSNLSIPLLGGNRMSLDIADDVIYPGFEKVVRGQGMPVAKHQGGVRGDLKVTFLVDFPKQLTQEQRLDISNILLR